MFCFPPYFRRFVEEKVFGVRNWLSPSADHSQMVALCRQICLSHKCPRLCFALWMTSKLGHKIESPPNHIKHSLTNQLLNHPEIKHFYYQTHMQRPSKTSDKLFQLTPTLKQKESFLQTTLSILRINILPQ